MTKDLFDRKKTKSDVYAFAQELIQEILQEDSELGENLRDWIKKKWVRITSSGKIGGPCGTSKKQSNPDRCLPQAKANSMTQSQRAATARKKKEGGRKGQQFVSNTKKGKVTTEQLEQLVLEVLAERRKKKKNKKKKSASKNKPGKATATHRADGKPKDACHKKVDGIYGMETSAYKSLAISKCRNVGVANYSSKKKKK